MDRCRYTGRLTVACLALTLPLGCGTGAVDSADHGEMSTSAGPGDSETGSSPSGEAGSASASGETGETDTAGDSSGGDGGGDGSTGDGDGDGDGDGGGSTGDGDGDELDCAGVDADTVLCRCFDGVYANGIPPGPDYDGLEADALQSPDLTFQIGSHCHGTNNQDIFDIERVVFLGDSVTVGTPPTEVPDYYRSQLADALATEFGLVAPGGLWKTADPFNGTSIVQDSGDFSNCSEWGARTDDFLMGGDQIDKCFPQDKRDLNTLVVMTMGGNDISRLAQDGIGDNPKPPEELWADIEQFVQYKRDAVNWLKDPLNLTGTCLWCSGTSTSTRTAPPTCSPAPPRAPRASTRTGQTLRCSWRWRCT